MNPPVRLLHREAGSSSQHHQTVVTPGALAPAPHPLGRDSTPGVWCSLLLLSLLKSTALWQLASLLCQAHTEPALCTHWVSAPMLAESHTHTTWSVGPPCRQGRGNEAPVTTMGKGRQTSLHPQGNDTVPHGPSSMVPLTPALEASILYFSIV